MRKNKITFFILFLCLISLFILTGCGNNDNSSENIKEKVIKELDYLDTNIIKVLNRLNNLSMQNYTITSEEISLGEGNSEDSSQGSSGGSGSGQSNESGGSQKEGSTSNSSSESSGQTEKSTITATQMEPRPVLELDESKIDWKTIKSDIETINAAWAIILLDLSSLNVDNNDILSFSGILDDTILSIKNENKTDALTNLAKLYSLIPKYESGISAPNSIQNIKQVKSYLINSYALVEQDNWTDIESNVSNSEKTFKNLVNDMEYVKNKEYKVNRTYVLIKELQNSLSYKDKSLFYVKYKTLMENINIL